MVAGSIALWNCPTCKRSASGVAEILSVGGRIKFLEIAGRSALAKLEVHPWVDQRPAKDRQRRGAILRENWAAQFEEFLRKIDGANVYVTIDIDCLRSEEAVTNWENGQFSVVDLAWAGKSGMSIAGSLGAIFAALSYGQRMPGGSSASQRSLIIRSSRVLRVTRSGEATWRLSKNFGPARTVTDEYGSTACRLNAIQLT